MYALRYIISGAMRMTDYSLGTPNMTHNLKPTYCEGLCVMCKVTKILNYCLAVYIRCVWNTTEFLLVLGSILKIYVFQNLKK